VGARLRQLWTLGCCECELWLAAGLGFRDPSRLAALFDHDVTAVDLDSRLDGRFLTGESFHSSAEALSVLLDELACHRLAAPRGLCIALGCYDDRALHEDVPRARERIGFAQAGFLG
jgi:hypothetical protein